MIGLVQDWVWYAELGMLGISIPFMTQSGFTWQVIDLILNHGLGLERNSSHNLTNNPEQFVKKV